MADRVGTHGVTTAMDARRSAGAKSPVGRWCYGRPGTVMGDRVPEGPYQYGAFLNILSFPPEAQFMRFIRDWFRSRFGPVTLSGLSCVPNGLAALDPSETLGVIWQNWKLAENFELRLNSLEFVFTNNYAVSTGYLAAGGDWASVAQHFAAHGVFFEHKPSGLSVIARSDLHSIANKHPCCFTGLEQAAKDQVQDFDTALKSAISCHCDLLSRLGRGTGSRMRCDGHNHRSPLSSRCFSAV